VSRIGCLVLALLLPAGALSQSLHERPVGTKLTSKSFQLGPKRIHTPEADWILIARDTWQGRVDGAPGGLSFAGAYIAEIQDGRLARAVVAFGNITPAPAGWSAAVDPCKRPATARVFRDMSRSKDDQFCFDVSEVDNTARVPEWVLSARRWLEARNVQITPIRLVARYAMIDRGYWFEVRYGFDPSGFGGDSMDQKVKELTRWAEENAVAVRTGLLPH